MIFLQLDWRTTWWCYNITSVRAVHKFIVSRWTIVRSGIWSWPDKMGLMAGFMLMISRRKKADLMVLMLDWTWLNHSAIGGIPDPRQIPSVLEFKSGGFHGSIYDVAIRFGTKRQFVQMSTSTGVQGSSKEWAVLKGRNVGDGDYDECSSRTPPCYSGGNCTWEGATYLCSCPGEWAGLYCSSRRVPCYGYDNPCISGTCRPDGHNIKCDCPLGKTGQFCDQGV